MTTWAHQASPETAGEKLDGGSAEKLEKKFDAILSPQVRESLGEENKAILGRIRGNFLVNGGNFTLALDNIIGVWDTPQGVNQGLHLNKKEKEELKAHILKLASLSPEGWVPKTDTQLEPTPKGDIPNKDEREKTPARPESTKFDSLKGFERMPEFDIINRLVKEGYIPAEKLEQLRLPDAPKDLEGIKKSFISMVQESQELDGKVKESVLSRIKWEPEKKQDASKDEKKAEYTESDFSKSDFLKDFQKVLPNEKIEFSPYTQFLAENHISIPNKISQGKEKMEEKKNTSDEKADIEATFSKCAKKIVIKEYNNPAFRSSHKVDIDTVLAEWWDLKEKFAALDRLFNASNADAAKKWQGSKQFSESLKAARELLKKAQLASSWLTEKSKEVKSIIEILGRLDTLAMTNDPVRKAEIAALAERWMNVAKKVGWGNATQEALDFITESNKFLWSKVV